jgi:hypothetical protein
MANKKPNEVSGWKSKLAALDSLPDEPLLDKNNKWEELHGRLQQRQGRKKALWYWAAAGVLLLFTLSVWVINQNQTNLPPTIAAKQPLETGLQPSVATQTSDTIYTTADVSAKTDIKSRHVVPQKQRDTVISTITMPQQMAVAETVAIAKTLPTILPADTHLVTAAATPLPAKKKLQVVHINDLDYPAITGPKIYTGQDYSVQQSRFINQPVYSTVSPGTGGIQFTISSNKKFSTN